MSYRQGEQLTFVEARSLHRQTRRLPSPDCDPLAMAKDATTLLTCLPDRRTVLIQPNGMSTELASRTLTDQGGPTAVFAFGDPWLLRYYGRMPAPTSSTGARGAVVNTPFPTGQLRASDLFAPVPSGPSACAPGRVLVRVESRFIMVRNAPHGRGTVYLTDCSGKPVSKRLGSVHSRTYVTAQLTARLAIFTSASRSTVVRLRSGKRYSWRFSGGDPASKEPVIMANAGQRLLVSVLRARGAREILSARLPR